MCLQAFPLCLSLSKEQCCELRAASTSQSATWCYCLAILVCHTSANVFAKLVGRDLMDCCFVCFLRVLEKLARASIWLCGGSCASFHQFPPAHQFCSRSLCVFPMCIYLCRFSYRAYSTKRTGGIRGAADSRRTQREREAPPVRFRPIMAKGARLMHRQLVVKERSPARCSVQRTRRRDASAQPHTPPSMPSVSATPPQHPLCKQLLNNPFSVRRKCCKLLFPGANCS